MNSNKRANELEDMKVNVKLKISALWIAVMFLYVYVDIFSLQKPGVIQDIMAGKIFVFQISQAFLFFTTLYVLVPILMIFLTLVMKPRVNRWVNIIVALFYFISILGGCIGEKYVFYIFGTIIESLLLLAIVIYSWKWPKQQS